MVATDFFPGEQYKRAQEEHPVFQCECRAPQPSPCSKKDLEKGCFATMVSIARLDARTRDCVLRRLPVLKEIITGWRGHGAGNTCPLKDSYSRFLQVSATSSLFGSVVVALGCPACPVTLASYLLAMFTHSHAHIRAHVNVRTNSLT